LALIYKYFQLYKMVVRIVAISHFRDNGTIIFSLFSDYLDDVDIFYTKSVLFSGSIMICEFEVNVNDFCDVHVDNLYFLGSYSVTFLYKFLASDVPFVRGVKTIRIKIPKSNIPSLFLPCNHKVLYYDMLEENGYHVSRPKFATRSCLQQSSLYSDFFHQVRMKELFYDDICCVCFENQTNTVRGVLPRGFLPCNHVLCIFCFFRVIQGQNLICPICRFSHRYPFGIYSDYLSRIQTLDESFLSKDGGMSYSLDDKYWPRFTWFHPETDSDILSKLESSGKLKRGEGVWSFSLM